MSLQNKFKSILNKSFSQDRHANEDMVCMKCRRLIREGDKLSDCCKKLGFAIDINTVIIDKTTGKVTQCSPIKEDS